MVATAPPLLSVFVRLSDLMAEGRRVLFRHAVHFGQVDQIVALASSRLHSFDARMHSLVARWRAGKLKRAAERKQPATKAVPPVDPAAAKPLRLPTAFGWLCKRIFPDGFATAEELTGLLADPEMTALIAAGPQAGRLLRPVCQMYGIKLDSIALAKRPRRKPEPDAAARARQAEREEAKAERELSKTSSKASVVPPGHTFPTTARGWAIWNRRARRAARQRRRSAKA